MADIHKPLSILAHVVVIAGIAYTVSQTALFFLAGPDEGAPIVERGAVRVESAAPRDVPIEQIAALHLFGQPRVAEVEEEVPEETLRDTRLSLRLVAVFVADQAEASSALVARKGGQPERFEIGETVVGNAELAAVYADRVVLSRGSLRENLRFETSKSFVQAGEGGGGVDVRADDGELGGQVRDGLDETAGVVAESSASRMSEQPPGPSVREAMDEYRAISPREVLERLDVGVTDVEASADAYTLGALADRPEFSHTGLQRGDRILSVNGRAVGDFHGDRSAIDRLLALGSASLEVQRGERRFVVTVSLN